MLRILTGLLITITFLFGPTHSGAMIAMAENMDMTMVSMATCASDQCSTSPLSTPDCATTCMRAVATTATAPLAPMVRGFGTVTLWFLMVFGLWRVFAPNIRSGTSVFSKIFQHRQIATVMLRN